MDLIYEKVKNAVMPLEGARVCVAVSGGSDSMCLIDCLLRGGIIDKARLTVVNVDHMIRGAASARDSAFVRDYCARSGLRLIFRQADIPALAAASGRSTETEARLFRRALFAEIVERGDADCIMTAHNADDNTETILMHIFRGCGLRGLVGMREREGCFCRPLLSVTKKEILAYNAAHGVTYVSDATNDDDAYTRNFIRLRVLPLVRSRYPQVGGALAALSRTAANALAAFPAEFDADGDSIKLPQSALGGENVRAALIAAGLTADFGAEHIAAVSALGGAATGAGLDLPHGYRAERESDGVRIYEKSAELVCAAPFAVGVTDFGAVRVCVTACAPVVPQSGTAIDLDKLPTDAVIRTRQSGDRFRPLGGHEKSLSDWLIDKKIPRYRRRRLLFIASGTEVLCVIGVATGEKLKIDENTAKAALVRAAR